MGLAVLPARLKSEMEELRGAILSGKNIREMAQISKHADWAEELIKKYSVFTSDNIDAILQKEIGIVFMKVLEDAGVFKRDEAGKAAFVRFINSLSD